MEDEVRAIPQGVPAIRPQRSSVGQGEAAFTEADVIAHPVENPIVGAGKVRPQGLSAIEQIEFVTSREVRDRLGFDTSMPDDTLLCVVTLRGPFTVSAPREVAPLEYPKAFRVYHAQTGNYLGQGGFK